jgi:hypothetical protein
VSPAFTKFNPRAFLESEEPRLEPAKAANPAKVSLGGAPPLATLATLAACEASSCDFAASANPVGQSSPVPAEGAAMAAYGGDPRGDEERERDLNPSCDRIKDRAFEFCIVEWLNQHPAPSPPGRCGWCGRPESPGAVVVPFGAEPGTHAWLHSECWPAWYAARKAEAIAALIAMGIPITSTC